MLVFNLVYKSVRFKPGNSYTLLGLVFHSEHFAIDGIPVAQGQGCCLSAHLISTFQDEVLSISGVS
jgi:hypothetical protein